LLLIWILIGFCSGYKRDYDRLRQDQLTLSVFSIGHGNCVLVTTPQKKTFVYDVGCISSPKRAADVMSRAIWRLGKVKIDAVIISHPDSDHFNGVELLADRFYIGRVFVSPYIFDPLKKLEKELNERKITFQELGEDEFKEQQILFSLRKKLEEKQIPVIEIGGGDTLSVPGLSDWAVLHPPKRDFSESDHSNATSLVLRFEHYGVGVLLPGDLDGRSLPLFLKQKPMSCEILMVPHHGGHSSQTEPLIQWASPKTLLLSAGRLTHKKTTLENYRRRGFVTRSTFEEGAIEININKQTVTKK
jgi:competence protein ComEC